MPLTFSNQATEVGNNRYLSGAEPHALAESNGKPPTVPKALQAKGGDQKTTLRRPNGIPVHHSAL